MCDILRPEPGRAYGLEEQARLQMLSVLLVAAGLTESDQYADFLRTAQDDFGLNPHLGVIFKRLMAFLLVTNAIVLGFAVSLCYAIWLHNVTETQSPTSFNSVPSCLGLLVRLDFLHWEATRALRLIKANHHLYISWHALMLSRMNLQL